MTIITTWKATVDKAVATLKRFPLPILVSMVAAMALMVLVDLKEESPPFYAWIKVLVAGSLALPFFTGLSFFMECRKPTPVLLWTVHAVALLLLGMYGLLFPDEPDAKELIRHVLLLLAVHLWVAVAPAGALVKERGFWEYNKTLFLRFLTAVLFSAVLFGGLCLAILASVQLFGLSIDETIYWRLWCIIATVFNTWFFLSDLPGQVDALNQTTDFPNTLRVFTQFVLLPLITVYLLILYIYGAKIIVTADWPKGWVSYLVIGFSTAGIFALLLVWPLRDDPRFSWIKLYSRNFFRALFPLILLLSASIFIRVRDYGITENRYFIIALACWLMFIAIYFLWSSTKRITVIPSSLLVLSLLAGYGPWSAFSVSEFSQRSRLESILQRYGLLTENGVEPLPVGRKMANDDLVQVSDILYYFTDNYNREELTDYVNIDVDSVVKVAGRYALRNAVLRAWRMPLPDSLSTEPDSYFSYYVKEYGRDMVEVSGYDYYVKFDCYKGTDSLIFKTASGNEISLWMNTDTGLLFERAGEVRVTCDIAGHLQKLLAKRWGEVAVEKESMTMDTVAGGYTFRTIIFNISGIRSSNLQESTITSVEGVVLVRLPGNP